MISRSCAAAVGTSVSAASLTFVSAAHVAPAERVRATTADVEAGHLSLVTYARHIARAVLAVTVTAA